MRWVLVAVLACLAFQVKATTLDVCPRGCAFHSPSDALMAANSGDIVHIQGGTYVNETLAKPITATITVRADKGTTIVLQPTGQQEGFTWLVIEGSITLEGQLTINLHASQGYHNRAIQVNKNGQLIQHGDLYLSNFTLASGHCAIIDPTARVTGIWNEGEWTQYGNVIIDTFECGTAIHTLNFWSVEQGANVLLTRVDASIGIHLFAGILIQRGNITVDVHVSSLAIYIYYEEPVAPGYPYPTWVQYGTIDLKLNESNGMEVVNGGWDAYGSTSILMPSSAGEHALRCRPQANVTVMGPLVVRRGNECYTLSDPHKCVLDRPVSCH